LYNECTLVMLQVMDDVQLDRYVEEGADRDYQDIV